MVRVYNQLLKHEEMDVDLKDEIVECLEKLQDVSFKMITRDIRDYAWRQALDVIKNEFLNPF